jgi:hypothetical protein
MGVAILAIVTQLVVGFAFLNWGGTDWGADLRGYLDATRSWMHGDGSTCPPAARPVRDRARRRAVPADGAVRLRPVLALPPVLGGCSVWVSWPTWSGPGVPTLAVALICLLAFPNMAIVYFRGHRSSS